MNNETLTSTEHTYRITFAGVGRGKKSWVSTIKQVPTEAILARLVRKSGALMSRDIECVFDEDQEYGEIYAGMRAVGAFKVEAFKITNADPFDAVHITRAFEGV
jgi:hypothetical protein